MNYAAIMFIFSILLSFTSVPTQIFAGAPDEIPPCSDPDHLPEQAVGPCAAILEFEEDVTPEEREEIIKGAGAKVKFNYKNVKAAAAHIPSNQSFDALLDDPRVKSIIPDRPIRAHGADTISADATVAETTPDGVKRIGAAPGALPVTGLGVGVAIVDTGIDDQNADLNVGAECFDAFGDDCYDYNGHGTHVAGIVAANDNAIDVVGVAPEATVYAVRVLNSSGSGSDSGIIAGLDWVADHADLPIDVVNMSLGRSGSLNDNPALRAAVQALTNLNITVVVSAGNTATKEVSSQIPAGYPEVLAIASSTAKDGTNSGCKRNKAITKADTASYFTTDGKFNESTGIGVTISAPGATQENIAKSCQTSSSGILSLKPGGGTVRMSGTSMAAPHVTGVVALMTEDAGGPMDTEVVRDILRASAARKGIAPLNSPTSSYTFDGEREGILSAPGALGI